MSRCIQVLLSLSRLVNLFPFCSQEHACLPLLIYRLTLPDVIFHSKIELAHKANSCLLVCVWLLPQRPSVPVLVSAAAARRCAPSPPARPGAPTADPAGSLARPCRRTGVSRPPAFWSTSQRADRERLRHTWEERADRMKKLVNLKLCH